MPEAIETLGDAGESGRIGRYVPKGIAESAVTEITAQQEQVMGYGRLLLAPLGNQLRGQSVAKIVKTRMQTCSVGDEVSGKPTESVIYGLLVQWTAHATDKEVVGEKGMAPPR